MEDVEAFDPTEEQLEILVSIYSAGGEANIADVVTGDTQTEMILDAPREEPRRRRRRRAPRSRGRDR